MNNDLEQNLARDLIREKRRDRLWRNLRALLWIVIALVYAYFIFGFDSKSASLKGPYVSLVRLSGVIMPGSSFSAQKALPVLDNAFKDHASRGVVIVINSPGGSPVQASIIHDRILALKKRYHKKVVAVGEDTLASGGYLVATAADKIFVNRDTLTGSIGVIFSSFGFVDAISKLGITRRVYTAGSNKDRLDPFEVANPEDVAKLKQVLDQVHQSFIQDVVAGRGERLIGDHEKLFSGDFWSGQQAVQLGLADGTDNLWVIVKKEFGAKSMKDFSARSSLLSDLAGSIGSELTLRLTESPLKEQAF